MTDPDPPKAPNRGRFQPGHKFGKGRPKGSPNKNLREKLLNGLAKSGAKRAKKSGVNKSVDGFEFFIEHLADTNSSAAASLVSKLIPPETPSDTSGMMPGLIVNVSSVATGQGYGPGGVVLLPFDELDKCWEAYRAGPEPWQEYLKTIKGSLTQQAYDNLSTQVPEPTNRHSDVGDDQPNNVTPLRLLEAPSSQIEPASTPQSPEEEQRVIDGLKDEINELAKRLGVSVDI